MKTLFCLALMAFPAVTWAAQIDYREFIGTYTLVSKKILEPGNSGPIAKMCTKSVVITHDPNRGFKTKLVGLYNSLGTNYYYDEESDETWLNISGAENSYTIRDLLLSKVEEGKFEAIGYYGSIFRPGNPKVRCIYRK